MIGRAELVDRAAEHAGLAIIIIDRRADHAETGRFMVDAVNPRPRFEAIGAAVIFAFILERHLMPVPFIGRKIFRHALFEIEPAHPFETEGMSDKLKELVARFKI